MEHQSVSRSPARLAFVCFLRTGIRLPESAFVPVAAALEAKFNPYHDPENGQFTFAPGGGGGTISDGVYRPDVDKPKLMRTAGSEPPRGIGHNGGPALDPVELEQAFPGLSAAPAGSIVAAADTLLKLTEPAAQMTTAMSLEYSKNLIAQIQAIDPGYQYHSLGFPSTFEGQMNMINDLRWDRAAAIYRKTGDVGALQIETIRFVQARADSAYDEAIAAEKAGTLKPALNDGMARGNFVDGAIRRNTRQRYNELGISTEKGSPVRVNSREYDTSTHPVTHSRPDVRVGNLAIDVTLQRKTPGTPQVGRFFGSDFSPIGTVIVRPRQVDKTGAYFITRPGK